MRNTKISYGMVANGAVDPWHAVEHSMSNGGTSGIVAYNVITI